MQASERASMGYLQLPCEILIGSESSGKAAPVLCSSVRHSSKASGLIVVPRGDLFLYFTLPKSKGRFLVFVGVFVFSFSFASQLHSIPWNAMVLKIIQDKSLLCSALSTVSSLVTVFDTKTVPSTHCPQCLPGTTHFCKAFVKSLTSFDEAIAGRCGYKLTIMKLRIPKSINNWKQFFFPFQRSKPAIFHVWFVCWLVCCCFSQSRISQNCDGIVGSEEHW